MNVFRTSPERTYKTYENADRRARQALLPNARYIIAATNEGRYFPVFIGQGSLHLLHSGYAVAN